MKIGEIERIGEREIPMPAFVHGAVPAPSRPPRTLFGGPRWSLFRNGNPRSPKAPTPSARRSPPPVEQQLAPASFMKNVKARSGFFF